MGTYILLAYIQHTFIYISSCVILEVVYNSKKHTQQPKQACNIQHYLMLIICMNIICNKKYCTLDNLFVSAELYYIRILIMQSLVQNLQDKYFYYIISYLTICNVAI